MKASVSLGWKAFVSRLHPPMPIAPKESARLLALLNTSFQQQLDRQHPIRLRDHDNHPNVHLRSVLTNPLFNKKNRLSGRLNCVQELLDRPMDAFTEQVAAGAATLKTATLCLQSQYNKCLGSPEAEVAAAMSFSKAGTTMLGWLWSSGREESGGFLTHGDFVRLMIKFLVAESQHQRIWLWLRKLESRVCENPVSANYQNYSGFLLQYLRSEQTVGKGMDSAIGMFVKIVEDTIKNQTERPFFSSVLYAAACQLTLKLISDPNAAKPSDPTVKALVNVAKMFRNKRGSYLDALHDVYLTESPKLMPALDYFQAFLHKDVTLMKPPQRLQKVRLGLKIADVCLDQGRQSEAISVMKILQAKFSNDIGLHSSVIRKTSPRNPALSEEQNLDLLDTLAVA